MRKGDEDTKSSVSDREKEIIKSIRSEILATCKHGGNFVDRIIFAKEIPHLQLLENSWQTLLHLSISFKIIDSIELLLSVGARTDIHDSAGLTAYDLALSTGIQEIIFKISRRESYQSYLQFIEKYRCVSNDDDSDDDVKTYARLYSESKMLEWDDTTERFDDYIDWTDSTRRFQYTKLLNKLDDRERNLNNSSRELIQRKQLSGSNLQKLHEQFRDKEHAYSLQIFDNIKLWRSYRRKLLRLSDRVNHIKVVLEDARKRIFWHREVSFRHYSGLILKFFTKCDMTLSGECLTLVEISKEAHSEKECDKDNEAKEEEEVEEEKLKQKGREESLSAAEKGPPTLKSSSDDVMSWNSSGRCIDSLGRVERSRSAASLSSSSIDEDRSSQSMEKAQDGRILSLDSNETASCADQTRSKSTAVRSTGKGGRKFMKKSKKIIERIVPLESIVEVEAVFDSLDPRKIKPQVIDLIITYSDNADSSSKTNVLQSLEEPERFHQPRHKSVEASKNPLESHNPSRAKEVKKLFIRLQGDSSISSSKGLSSGYPSEKLDLIEQVQDFEFKLRNLTKEDRIKFSYLDSKRNKRNLSKEFSATLKLDDGRKFDELIESSGMNDTDQEQSEGRNNFTSDEESGNSHSRSCHSRSVLSGNVAIQTNADGQSPLLYRSQSCCERDGVCNRRSMKRNLKPLHLALQPSKSDKGSSVLAPTSTTSSSYCQASNSTSVGLRSSVSGVTSIEGSDFSSQSANTQGIDRLLMKLLNDVSVSGALSELDFSLIESAGSYSSGLSSLTTTSLRNYLDGERVADGSTLNGDDLEGIKKILTELSSVKNDSELLETLLQSIEKIEKEKGRASCSGSNLQVESRSSSSAHNNNMNNKVSRKISGDNGELKPSNELLFEREREMSADLNSASLRKLISKRSKHSCKAISLLEAKLAKNRTEREMCLNKLLEVIKKRESLLECLRYLRSLRVLASNPPPSPTSNLSLSKVSSMEEVLDKMNSLRGKYESPRRSPKHQMQSIHTRETRVKSDASDADSRPSDSSRKSGSKGRFNLERSEEIRLTLLAPVPPQPAISSSSVSPSSSSSSSSSFTSPSKGSLDYPNLASRSNLSTPLAVTSDGSVLSTPSTVRASPWKVSLESQSISRQPRPQQRTIQQASLLSSSQRNTLAAAAPASPGSSSPTKAINFDECCDDSLAVHPKQTALPPIASETVTTKRADIDYPHNRRTDRYCPLHLGNPPEECREDLAKVIELLRELWDCELKSFETVGKLTEIFVLRAETLTELGKLAEQERKPPPASELFDIQL